MRYDIESISVKNTRKFDKTNEDLVYFDDGFGTVLDGVTRDKENGIYPEPSPAYICSELFRDSLIEEKKKNGCDDLKKLCLLIEKGNRSVYDYNKKENLEFAAGTVGIVYSIVDNYILYGYVGDCYGMIIRDCKRRIFTECQTDSVLAHKKELTTKQIRYEICNHIEHPFGYGVWDGNPGAMDFTKYGHILLKENDVILLFTDGMYEECMQVSDKDIAAKSLDTLFGCHELENADDRSLIRIRVLKE